MSPEDPIVHAMLLCDHVHYDEVSGKHTILGVCDAIGRREFPAELDGATIYLCLTNMNGRYAVELAWLRGDTEAELARFAPPGVVTSSDPLARISIDGALSGLPLPAPGRYVLRLWVNGHHLHDSVIMVGEV